MKFVANLLASVAAVSLLASIGHAAEPDAAPAAAPPASDAAPAAGTPAAPAVTADEEYDLKMRELEGMVGELKEQIFRSKAKLQLLAEQVAGGAGAGAKVVITHKNLLGGSFLVTEAAYFLDGQPIWQESDETGLKLTEKRDVPVWDGSIVEGSHTLSVRIKVRGNGSGVFQYLSGYNWTLKDALTFTAEPGKVLAIETEAFEKGNFTTPLEERPSMQFQTNMARQASSPAPGATP